MLDHLTAAATPRYAADISGVFTTSMQIAGAIGVASFGTLYLALTGTDAASATKAFAAVTTTFALATLTAAALAYGATHPGHEHRAPVRARTANVKCR